MFLFFSNEIVNNGFNILLLIFLSIISVSCAIFVIISKNPVISVLYLIGLFLAIAFYLISIGATFIGISYLLVYVGAVSILFLFILMLINIRISELISDSKNSILLVFLIGLSLVTILSNIIPVQDILEIIKNIIDIVFSVNNNYWDNGIVYVNSIESLGSIMYTNCSILLLVVSIILLLAMVGAIIITIKPHDFYPTINIKKNISLPILNSKLGPQFVLIDQATLEECKDLINKIIPVEDEILEDCKSTIEEIGNDIIKISSDLRDIISNIKINVSDDSDYENTNINSDDDYDLGHRWIEDNITPIDTCTIDIDTISAVFSDITPKFIELGNVFQIPNIKDLIHVLPVHNIYSIISNNTLDIIIINIKQIIIEIFKIFENIDQNTILELYKNTFNNIDTTIISLLVIVSSICLIDSLVECIIDTLISTTEIDLTDKFDNKYNSLMSSDNYFPFDETLKKNEKSFNIDNIIKKDSINKKDFNIFNIVKEKAKQDYMDQVIQNADRDLTVMILNRVDNTLNFTLEDARHSLDNNDSLRALNITPEDYLIFINSEEYANLNTYIRPRDQYFNFSPEQIESDRLDLNIYREHIERLNCLFFDYRRQDNLNPDGTPVPFMHFQQEDYNSLRSLTLNDVNLRNHFIVQHSNRQGMTYRMAHRNFIHFIRVIESNNYKMLCQREYLKLKISFYDDNVPSTP